MDSGVFIEQIAQELSTTLAALEGSQSLDEKVQYSVIVKNLSESMSVFLAMPCGYQPNEIDDDAEAEIHDALEGKFA